MSIKQNNKNKTYDVFYSKRHPETRVPISRRRKGIKTMAEAKRVYTNLILEVDKIIHKTIVPQWTDVVEEYIDDLKKRDISLKTIETYHLCLKAHTFGEWRCRLVDSISSQEIRSLIIDKVGDKSPSHQKNLLKYIRGAFSFAVDKNYISRNPVPSMKFKIGDKIKNVLTEDQINVLLTQAKIIGTEWYPVWAMALYTGMRNGELYALTWDKVNFENRQILVDTSWNNKDGFKSTKSGNDRIVEIAPELLTVMKELKLKNLNPPFVLPRIDIWDKGEQARDLRTFLEGLGLPRIRFHDLRASWATVLLSKGIAPIMVMAMGGWKDLKTMQYYIRMAGVNIKGITDGLSLHNPLTESARLLSLNSQLKF